MKNSLRIKTLAALAGTLAGAFALTGCGDSKQDAAQRPGLTDAVVNSSVQNCETGSQNGNNEDYSTRLRDVLKHTKVSAMKTLAEKDITVCLDQRLSSQTKGFWDSEIHGVYYNQAKDSTVTLWDNGKDPASMHWYNTSVTSYGSDILNDLAPKIRKGKIPAAGENLYAIDHYCGKGCTTQGWDNAKDTGAVVNKNPVLKIPPRRNTAQQPIS